MAETTGIQTSLNVDGVASVITSGRLKETQSVTLRPYQTECVTATELQLKTHQSTLIVIFTGGGKSVILAELIRRQQGRVLVLAHRWELLDQLRKHVGRHSGEIVDLEQAGNTSDGARVVVASIQTIQQRKRLERFGRGDFSLVVIDEAHHAVSAGYKKVLEYFTDAKVIGCTATADRLDKVGMHNVFKSVSFRYDIASGIHDGWLSRILSEHINVQSIDIENVGTSGGDLQVEQLDAIMRSRESLFAIAKATIDRAGGRPTVVFTTTVQTGKLLVDAFNARRPGCADAVFGETGFEARGDVFKRHKSGEFQFLINVGVATEGWDGPYVSCIALGRPTKSRSLLTQMIGRGTRLSPATGKENLLVLDFVGNTGRHKLITPADILGGKLPPEVVAKAKAKLESASGDVMELLDQEERAERERVKLEAIEKAERERAMLARAKATVRYEVTTADLFGFFKLDTASLLFHANETIQPGQVFRLREWGIPIPADLNRAGAAAIIKRESGRRFNGWATYKQVQLLARYGVDGTGVRMRDVTKVLEAAKNERKAA